ncbi:hypothetical protein [Dinghuibacter silviterrae]|uniref:PA14 domain-containing protein n=1 Tax=Dinghuibacter silviterrae TaxID=1539049 RepID=A0A4R8DUK6_9BACT|nr:hypothetical protein [Dinghuibacter silviterrae]TDX02072.1 hypothetical protein EDB95_3121 [Dinghuibacter silviterrae]
MITVRIQKYSKEIAALLIALTVLEYGGAAIAMIPVNRGPRGARSAGVVPGAGLAVRNAVGAGAPQVQMLVPANAEPVPNAAPAARAAAKRGPGPGQPEQQTFQSVNTDNMVDLFSGDFTYNIPLLDLDGYPVNIHYRSGISMDQEASWVGLGWNINPGAINRNMRGIPDDFDGDTVIKTQSVRTNWTAGVNLGASPEFFGLPASVSLNAGLFYNNYRGIGFETGGGINISLTSGKAAQGGLDAGVGINLNNNSQNGFSIEPSFFLNRTRMENLVEGVNNGFSVGASFSTRTGLKDLNISTSGSRLNLAQTADQRHDPSGFNGSISFAHQSYTPTINLPYTSYQFNFSVKLGGEVDGLHPLGSIAGYFSSQAIDRPDTVANVAAHGYMYLQNGLADPGSMLDFNRQANLPAYCANPQTPNLAIPNYTYDLYSISGEGTGGMFRPYRGDIGYVRDPVMHSKAASAGGSIDLGAGDVFHGGIDARFSYTTTTSGAWTDNNLLAAQNGFTQADSTYENVYFKNPSEKAINAQSYYDKLGDTKVLLPVMTNSDDPTLTTMMQGYVNDIASGPAIPVTTSVTKTSRDKRSQVISFLNAGNASTYGLDNTIHSYPLNQFPLANCGIPTGVTSESRVNFFRKAHHFSEITVLNTDGKRYVYGLPVYNLDQEEVSFSVNKSGSSGNLVNYQPIGDNHTSNQQGKDHFYSRETIKPYASTFLITGLVSPDYVDRTGDGITDDDQGDAVKFNYTKLYGVDNPYRWRTPYSRDSATYQEGLKTDYSDDKGSYVYGTKEIWYMNSIVTKTMVATFTLNDPAKNEVRQDGYGVIDENGGLDPGHGLRYLKQIDLYTKADYMNYLVKGITPTPVKTVHFVYSYTLCPGAPGSLNGQGKLTLDSIWFSYNGNDKGHQNPYVFHYHPNNPRYDNSAYDRWGNYKQASSNPGGLSNMDYPYALQDSVNNWDSTQAANAVGAWTLDSIKLPSTGGLKIDYEADDYAYVQNKRATEMMSIAGFAPSSSFTGDGHLFNGIIQDYGYVFIHVPNAVQNRTDVYNKYLQGISEIYFTYRVKMPSDVYGGGFEHVAVYAQYDDYGVNPSDPHMIWVHMKSAEGGLAYVSPLAKAAIQALRLNLPSKAYPGSDLDGAFDPIALGKALIGYIVNFSELITNFATRTRLVSSACLTDLSKSFVRLDNAEYRKFGGGLRVKRITIWDNFHRMTGQQDASYGQEYSYTTTATINGVPTTISSGVAAWEPSIGNEENPFRTPIEYTTQVSPLAPSNNMYTENPLGEGYFPGAEVGYSKVRIHTIHGQVASAGGYQESQFYTTYDFPTLVEQTPLDQRQFKPSFLSNLFKIDAKSYLAQTQGFKVEINDMNGKPKSVSSFPENDPYNPVSYTQYYYKTDNDSAVFKHLNNEVAVVDAASGHINPSAQIGKDIEVMVDLREENTQTKGIDLEFNTDAFVLGIIPLDITMVWPFPQWEADRYRSAATMKLVQRYGILDKVLNYNKGSLVTTQNLVYDGETGDVVLSSTQNEFNDPVYDFHYPAHWAYSGMEPAYKNIGAVFSNVTFRAGKIQAPNYPNIEHFFESGDEVIVTNAYNKTGVQSAINPCTGEGICAASLWSGTPNTYKLWAISASKIQNNKGLTGIYFMDQFGNFFTGISNPTNPLTIQILRSGKRNLLGDKVGDIQSLASPVRVVNGQWQLVFDDQTRIINTTAQTFSDFWKVQDAKFVLSTQVTTRTPNLRTAYIFPATLDPELTISNEFYGGRHRYTYPDRPYFEAAHMDNGGSGKAREIDLYSWLRLSIPTSPQSPGDVNYIPPGAVITKAWMFLRPHLADHTETTGLNSVSIGQKNHNATNPHYLDHYAAHNFELARVTDTRINSLNFASTANWPELQLQDVIDYGVANTVSLDKTLKENSYEVDVTTLLQQMIATGGPTVLRLGPVTGQTDHFDRLCFWASDQCLSTLGGGGSAAAASATPAVSAVTTNAVIPPRRVPPPRRPFPPPPPPPPPPSPCQAYNEPGGYTGPGGTGYCGLTKNPQASCPVGPYIKVTYLYCEPGTTQQTVCDTTYCIKTSSLDTCLSNITDTTVNPYRFGILGNWRTQKAYTYVDNRKQTDFSQHTDIRNDGTMINYLPYWSFTSAKMSPATDTVKWIWSVETTLFNKRGLQQESRNALGIYNAVQYGFNQSLPLAVIQNAAYKQAAYDGFEDYNFGAAQSCNRCIIPRHLVIDSAATNITSAEAHTGKYSMFIGPGHAATATCSVTADPDSAGMLTMKLDTTILPMYRITTFGFGLADTFYNYSSIAPYYGDNYGLDNYNYSNGPSQAFPGGGNVDYDSRSRNPITTIGNKTYRTYYRVVWQGALMTPADLLNVYFRVSVTNSFKMWINDSLVFNLYANDPTQYDGSNAGAFVYAGPYNFRRSKIYRIRIEHEAGQQGGLAHLYMGSSPSGPFSAIPTFYLYTSVAAAQRMIHTTLTPCIDTNGVTAQNVLYKELSPSVGSQLLVSTWVKEQQDCHCKTYTHGSLAVYFSDVNGNPVNNYNPVIVYPSGNIIDGWQRIEDVVTVPAGSVFMRVVLSNYTFDGYTGTVYFDDLRIQPFNGEMKSYVYDDASLRLMAQLDENNYATFFEYNDDGTLIRVKKETEQGIKTIKETRSALVKDIP